MGEGVGLVSMGKEKGILKTTFSTIHLIVVWPHIMFDIKFTDDFN